MYVFDDFTLDVREHSLRRGDRVIHLRPKTFETLLMLVKRRGEVVKKDDLLESLWSGVIVTEGALSHCIEEARTALKDDPHHPRYIQTVPKVGYKFVAEVRTENDQEEGAKVQKEIEEEISTSLEVRVNEETVENEEMTVPLSGRRVPVPGRRISTTLIAGALALIAIITLGVVVLLLRMDREEHSAAIRSIAVLPFKNLAQNSEQEYVADGLTDALTAELARIGQLRVLSRTSATRAKERKMSLTDVASAFDVDAVIEGSVLRSGDRVLITAELIDARKDRHLWSESYDREFKDVVQTLRQVTMSIAGEIRISLTTQESTHLVNAVHTDPAAYEAYLKGRYFWNKRWDLGFRNAMECFEEAVARDPGYAAAYAGLADCYNMLGNYDLVPPKQAFPRAKAAALKALELDASLADAHASLGFTLMMYDWRWTEAESEYQQAIALNPSCVSAHHWYALYQAMHGKFNEASAEMNKAKALDPLSLIVLTNSGWVRYFAGDYEGAIRIFHDCLQMDPDFISTHIKLGWAYEQSGQPGRAVDEFQLAFTLAAGDRAILLMCAHAYALAGQRDQARDILSRVLQHADSTYVPAFHVGDAYAALGDKDRAFRWLRKAVDERSGWLCWLRVDPKLEGLRGDARFRALLDSLAL